MGKLRHIPMPVPDLWKAAEFCAPRRGGNGYPD